jgi:hypothetical protein
MVLAPLPPASLAACLAIVVVAGVVRGFAGFGFSALSIAGMSLFVSPAQVIPAVFILEVLASLGLLRSALRDVDWHWLSWLALGNALFIPVGVALLAVLPEQALRLVIGALLAVAALLLRSGVKFEIAPTVGGRLFTGLVSGLVNGLAAIGGIAVALLLSTSRMPPATLRATLILLFVFTDVWALATAAMMKWTSFSSRELVGGETLVWAAWLVVPMAAGIWVGQRLFAGVSDQAFRRFVLDLLLVLAVVVVARAAWG